MRFMTFMAALNYLFISWNLGLSWRYNSYSKTERKTGKADRKLSSRQFPESRSFSRILEVRYTPNNCPKLNESPRSIISRPLILVGIISVMIVTAKGAKKPKRNDAITRNTISWKEFCTIEIAD